ncbi:MAG: CDP-glycerol glycerophosphotransferase family protein [Patescibacteria group bacterium]|mgnify:CR=1 FL=1
MKTVFLFVSNYVYSSDFLRTEYIRYLSVYYRVIVFAPSGLFEGGKPYFVSPNVVYVKWNVQSPRFWSIFGKLFRYSLIRKYDFEPVVKRNRERGLKNWHRKMLWFFSHLFPKNFWNPDFFLRLEILLAPRSFSFERSIEKYKPAIVLTASPGFNHFDAEAIVLAKRAGIKTAAINFSWDNLHNGGIHFRRTDYLLVWNEVIRQTAINEYGYSPHRVLVSGIIRFDHYFKSPPNNNNREAFLKSKGLNPDAKTILLTTTTDGNYPDEDIVLDNLIQARMAGRFPNFPNIFVRMHPKENITKFMRFSHDSSFQNICIEKAGTDREVNLGSATELSEEDLDNLKYTLEYSDVIVNYASTITLEAFAFDKPVININYPQQYERAYSFRHYKPIVDAGAVRLPKSFNDLVSDINSYLKNPEKDKFARESIVEKLIGHRDGLSYKRSVDLLLNII